MRITLDWDEEADKAEHFEAVRNRPQLDGGEAWQLRRSSTNGGYHYEEWGAAGDWQTAMQLRSEYGDDEKRIRMDMTRQMRGSPFLQVLYHTKYMERWGWDPETGNSVQVLDGSVLVEEGERIKNGNRLDYQKIARLLATTVFDSHKALADSIGMGRSSVTGWINGDHDPSAAAREKLKRRARHYGLGHYHDDKSMENMGLDVAYTGDKERRRTIVEYLSVPWADDDETLKKNADPDDDSEERTLNVHTGTFNEAHSEGQLKYIHDKIEETTRNILSPDNPDNNLPSLSLDRENNVPQREADSVNYENALLDKDEARYYRANMVGKTENHHGVTTDEASKLPIFEVVLWDDEMQNILWHVIGVWAGETVADTVILRDSQGWW